MELGAAKFDAEIEHKHTHTFYMQHYLYVRTVHIE